MSSPPFLEQYICHFFCDGRLNIAALLGAVRSSSSCNYLLFGDGTKGQFLENLFSKIPTRVESFQILAYPINKSSTDVIIYNPTMDTLRADSSIKFISRTCLLTVAFGQAYLNSLVYYQKLIFNILSAYRHA